MVLVRKNLSEVKIKGKNVGHRKYVFAFSLELEDGVVKDSNLCKLVFNNGLDLDGKGKYSQYKLEGTYVSENRYHEICDLYSKLDGGRSSIKSELRRLIDFGNSENYYGDEGFVIHLNSLGDGLKSSGLVRVV